MHRNSRTNFERQPEWKNKVQIAKITHSFSGCFGGGKSVMLLSRFDTGYLAEFIPESKNRSEKVLSSSQLIAFENFIAALKKIKAHNGICTTSESFSVVYNNEVIERYDESCQFTQYDVFLSAMKFSYYP